MLLGRVCELEKGKQPVIMYSETSRTYYPIYVYKFIFHTRIYILITSAVSLRMPLYMLSYQNIQALNLTVLKSVSTYLISKLTHVPCNIFKNACLRTACSCAVSTLRCLVLPNLYKFIFNPNKSESSQYNGICTFFSPRYQFHWHNGNYFYNLID